MVGDEIVNVNGRRLRGLTMHEAKTVLRNCCQSRDVDIVVARREEGEGADGRGGRRGAPVAVPPSSSAAAAVPMAESAPLSLLAAHDEQDLINLV